MKTLELEFEGTGEVRGVRFRQMLCSDKAFLYELTDGETGSLRYEVFERKVQKEMDVDWGDKVAHYEEKEMYPKSNSFGSWAWCTRKYDRAKEIYDELNAKKEEVI